MKRLARKGITWNPACSASTTLLGYMPYLHAVSLPIAPKDSSPQLSFSQLGNNISAFSILTVHQIFLERKKT